MSRYDEKPDLKTFGGRLRFVRLSLGLSFDQTAERINRIAKAYGDKKTVRASALCQLEKKKNSCSKVTVRIAMALGVSPYFLELGKVGEEYEKFNPARKSTPDQEYPILSTYCPLYGWSDIGGKIIDYKRRIAYLSDRAFCVIIDGDSMISNDPDKNSFFPDDLVFIDPDLEINYGDFVLAKVNNGFALRKIISDCGKDYLVPLNRQYPSIEISPSIKVIGRFACKISPNLPFKS